MEFDIIIVGLVLFLSLKGIVNGFTKELFNFIGLVGGVALASRINVEVGELISKNLYPITNEASIKLVGFVATLLAIWILFLLISSIVDKFSSDDIDIFSRILGYILTIARYIAIFSIIIIGIGQSDFLSEKLSKYYQGSQLFPILKDIGNTILNNPINGTSIKNGNDINLSDFPMDINHTKEVEDVR